MNESQDACRDYFQCSCKELDELVEICRFELPPYIVDPLGHMGVA